MGRPRFLAYLFSLVLASGGFFLSTVSGLRSLVSDAWAAVPWMIN